MTEEKIDTDHLDETVGLSPEPASPERLVLTVSEAASMLGVNRKVVYEAVHAGQIPARRIGKRRIVIVRAALLDWLSQGRVLPSEKTD